MSNLYDVLEEASTVLVFILVGLPAAPRECDRQNHEPDG
jgi:hypothetical protein